MRSIILSLIIIIITLVQGMSQDIHFAQFYKTPLLLNPALSGVFHGNHRAYINYRDQWRSIGAPYKTYAVSYDTKFFKDKWEKSYLGAGLSAFSDKAGDAELSTIQVNLSVSGIVPLNKHHKISAGLQGGFAQKSVDYANISTDNQYVNGAYDPAQPVGETNTFNTPAFGDFTAGVSWDYIKNDKYITSNDQLTANAGIAVYHINKPKQEFFTSNLADIERLYTKLVVHGRTFIGLKNTNIALVPSFMVLQQGSAREINIGALGRFRMKEGSKYTGLMRESAVYFGTYYRAGDAIIPAFMLEIASITVGISYDINISELKEASNRQGGFEISLRYINPNPYKRAQTRTLY